MLICFGHKRLARSCEKQLCNTTVRSGASSLERQEWSGPGWQRTYPSPRKNRRSKARNREQHGYPSQNELPL